MEKINVEMTGKIAEDVQKAISKGSSNKVTAIAAGLTGAVIGGIAFAMKKIKAKKAAKMEEPAAEEAKPEDIPVTEPEEAEVETEE